MPAMRATWSGSPLGFEGSAARTAAESSTNAEAEAVRRVAGLALTSTMRAWPAASKWESFEALRALCGLGHWNPQYSNMRTVSPAERRSASSGIYQKAIGVGPTAARSPEPCQSTRRTVSNSPRGAAKLQIAGRNRVRPGFPVTSSARFASAKCGPQSIRPPRARRMGAAKSRNVTAEDTGFPGSPNSTSCCLVLVGIRGRELDKDQRFAGLNANASEMKTSAEACHGGLDEVEFAGRDSSADQDEISLGWLA